ncbi:MAG: cell division protein FtsQ/DivIB, partial [Pseudobdellovibrionaceae bacterium]
LWTSSYIGKVREDTSRSLVMKTAHMGLRVENVLVEGRHFADRKSVATAVDVDRNEPLFALDLASIRDRLQADPWIESVTVRRQFPHTLKIDLTERTPLALLRRPDKGLSLIDTEGKVITKHPDNRFKELLIVSGQGAAKALPQLMTYLQAEPNLPSHITSVQYIGGRRWNLFTANDTRIQLPEDDLGLALARLSRYQSEDDVLEQPLKDIDLRQSDRIVLQPVDEAEGPIIKASATREADL